MRPGARLLFGAAAVAAAAACSEIGLGPDDVLSLRFDALPFPAVVLGDSLRAPDGAATPLSADVFRGSTEVPDATVRFLALTPDIVEITPEGFVIGVAPAPAGIRVIATVDGLQSQPLTLFVVDTPTTLAPQSAVVDTLEYLTMEEPLSEAFSVRVRGRNDAAVPGWIVDYRIVEPPADAPGRLVRDRDRASQRDTTDAQGIATRRFQLTPARITNPSLIDTVEVEASASYRGAPLPGSPVRFFLLLRPRNAS